MLLFKDWAEEPKAGEEEEEEEEVEEEEEEEKEEEVEKVCWDTLLSI